jgi:hypothetical protein
MWVLRVVLPSIRQYGFYQLEQKYKYKLDDISEKLKNERNKVEMLENNQKKQKFPDGGLVYALEPMGLIPKDTNKKIIRIGKSEFMKNRWSTYNTAVPDNFKLLYYIETDNPSALEYCIRSLLNKFIYRTGKDYYLCSLGDIVRSFNECFAIIKKDEELSKCEKCNSLISVEELEDHLREDHNMNIKQTGGNDEIFEVQQLPKYNEEYHKKYLKYKKKYIDLKYNS